VEVLAIRQIRFRLDLLEKEEDIKPYLDRIPESQRNAMVFVLNQLVKGVKE